MATSVTYNPLSTTSLASLGDSDAAPDRTTGDIVLIYMTAALRFGVSIPLLVLCCVSSAVNVITFCRMNRSEGVTQNLLILSITDTVYITMAVPIQALTMLRVLGFHGEGVLSVTNLINVAAAVMNCPLFVSQMVTTIIAVIRCCSIVMPLSFRDIFTARRQLAAIVLCSGGITGYLLYVMCVLNVMRFRTASNSTSNNYRDTDTWKNNMFAFDIFRNVLFFTCLGTIVISMVFLIIALRKSSQFQRSATSVAHTGPSSKSTPKPSVSRDIQVIKTVILILAIFVVCNLPTLFLSIMRRVFPEFNSYGKYRLGQTLLLTVSGAMLRLNVGLNFFVYYRYNSRFRQLVRAMFNAKSSVKQEST